MTDYKKIRERNEKLYGGRWSLVERMTLQEMAINIEIDAERREREQQMACTSTTLGEQVYMRKQEVG